MIEPDRDIILHCDDWAGDYKVEGRMMKPNGNIKNVFCTFDKIKNKWVKNSKEWSQREGWSYKPTPQAEKE